MKSILLLIASLAVAALPALADGEKGTKFGDGVTLESSVKVADMLAAPDKYLGKKVRVDGVIRAVCQTMGCWIQLADADNSDGIQFKVDDGVIVFPKDAKGRKASAEGTFEAIGAAGAEEAEHAKEATGVATVPKYRIRATGAVIY
ncbi:MAG TPA: DUF4920 domain-containing protein [Vicinamibacterales bacterium]|nr:DUF4920 domain-containing protein [Vicinamibacterales bacterium]